MITSSDGNQSLTLPFEFNKILIENYNSTLKGTSAIEVQFQIKNYFSNLNVEWNITASDKTFKSPSPITLAQGESTSITQEINFTTRGVKPLKITIYSGNLTDTYSESIRLYSLDITDFLNIVKNGTTRIFNFVILNDWINLTAYWNISNPTVQNTVNLTSNESLIVVIEENYGQGKKNVEVKLYNQTFLEDKITEKLIYVNSHNTQLVMKMPNITLSIPEELHNFVKKHSEIKWSEIARRAMWLQANKLKLMDTLADKSKLTVRDIEELDHKIKAGLLKRYSK